MEKILNENIVKIVHNIVGVFILFQNIYFYDEKFSWTVIPVYLIFTVIIDFKKVEVRSFEREFVAILSFFIFSLSIILLKLISYQAFYIPSSFFLVGTSVCILDVISTFSLFLNNDLSHFINDKNAKLIEKQTAFIPIFLFFAGVGLVFTVTRVLIL